MSSAYTYLFLLLTGACNFSFAANFSAKRIQNLYSTKANIQSISYYTDNGDRQALAALRAKNPSLLTTEEKAILEASNRIGYLHLPGCHGANNAVLININGYDAIVATGHTVIEKTGVLKCSADEDAFYYPNASYLNQRVEIPAEDSFILKKIKLETNPINFENHIRFRFDTRQDFLIYYLTENISKEILPVGTYNAGRTRGAMPISTVRQRTGTVYIMGLDGRYEKEYGRQMSYQRCEYEQNTRMLGFFSHNCDISPGSSGSLLGTIENNHMTLQAINSRGPDTYDTPTPEGTLNWNTGLSSGIFLRSIPIE